MSEPEATMRARDAFHRAETARHARPRSAILTVWLLSLAVPISAYAEIGFVGLGFLPERGASRAYAISADGRVVVGRAEPDPSEAFRWTEADGMTGLGFLTDFDSFSIAYATSADGSVVVGRAALDASFTGHAFRWTQADGIADLGDLIDDADAESTATGVSDDGSVVVGRSSSILATSPFSADEAFRWTEATGMVPLGFLPDGLSSEATGVSGDGNVVVGTSTHPGIEIQTGATLYPDEAFRWTEAGGMQGLGYLPPLGPGAIRFSRAVAISRDGQVIVGRAGESYADGTTPPPARAFLWTQATGMVDIGLPAGSTYVEPTAISGDGSLIVGFASSFGTFPFIWDAEHGFRHLYNVLRGYGIDPSPFFFITPRGISADGTVIVGDESLGPSEAWRAEIPSIPTACEDGEDNDGDGAVDHPMDPGCSTTYDLSEQSDELACDDGIDNDGDGLADLADPGCPFSYATIEDPPCDDGTDNDGDGFTDFADPNCASSWPYWEALPCGLGAELALALPLIFLAASRRRRAS